MEEKDGVIGALLDRRAAEEALRRFGAEVDFRWETGSTNDDLKAAGKRRAFDHPVAHQRHRRVERHQGDGRLRGHRLGGVFRADRPAALQVEEQAHGVRGAHGQRQGGGRQCGAEDPAEELGEVHVAAVDVAGGTGSRREVL